MGQSILVVWDDGPGAADLVARLKENGFAARAAAPADVAAAPTDVQEDGAGDGEHADPAHADPAHPDLALVALAPDGIEAAQRLANGRGIPIAYLADDPDADLLARARDTRPFGYLATPATDAQLRLSIESALAAHARAREHRDTEERLRRRIAGMQSRQRLMNTKKAEPELQKTIGELQDQKALLDTVLDAMTEGVIVASVEEQRIVYANRSAIELVAEPVEDLDPSEWAETYGVYHLDGETLVDLAEMPIVRALFGESTGPEEYLIRNDKHAREGTYVSATAHPLLSGTDGNVTGAVGIILDVTRYRKVEARLRRALEETREHDALMRTVFASMSDGVVVADEGGRFTVFNPAAERIVGVGMLDIPPDQWTDRYGLFYPDRKTHIPTEELPLVRAMNGKRTVEMEIFVRNEKRPEGVYIVVNSVPLEREVGGHAGGVAVFRDITERRKAEMDRTRALNELREQTELMNTVFDSINDGILAIDRAGEVIHVNRHAFTVSRIEGEIAPSDTWSDRYGIYYPDRVTRVNNEDLPVLRAALKGEVVDDEDIVLINQESPEGLTLRVSAHPIMGPDGSHRGGVAVFRDVTERRKAETERTRALNELREQTELTTMVFDTIDHGVVVVDETGTVVYTNRVAYELTKIEGPGATLDRRSEGYRIFYPDRQTPVEMEDVPILRAAFKGEVIHREDFVLISDSDPEGVALRADARPLLHSDGSRRGAVAVFRDVTEARKAEDALAEAFAQGKIEIIDTILHNVGNAVNSVTTGVDTIDRELRDDTLTRRLQALANALEEHSDDWTDYIENDPQGQVALPFVIALGRDIAKRDRRIRKAAERAKGRSEHIADIIRTQRAFKNQAALTKDVDVRDSVAAAVGLLEPAFEDLRAKVETVFEGVPRFIRTQESDLQQMLVNLIRNSLDAIKARRGIDESEYAPRIQVRCHVREPYLVIDVEDNGIGIPEDKLKSIFSAGFTTKREGTGLGLHSAAIFVNRSGGRIRAVSKGVGHGARIRVEMRLSPPDDETSTPRGIGGGGGGGGGG